jgi:glycosyl transferase family 2
MRAGVTAAERPGGTGATPAAWRAVALGILAGGFLVGYRSAGGRTSRIALGAALVAIGSAVPIARAGRKPPIPPGAPPRDPATSPPTFSVIVAARDEAGVLPNLIADLGAQDHRTDDGRPKFELIVIDDRSIDGTPQGALRAASAAGLGSVTRLVRRTGDASDGKGAALTAVPPDTCRGDVIVVLDADARIAPSFLSTVASYAAAGADALTARRRIFGAHRSHLAGAQTDEQTLDGEIQRGRWALGGCSEFRGNGIIVRRSLLEDVGGWRAEALTEDIDLSSRVAASRGVRVAWAIDAEVWEEPVTTWSDLWRQRVRWAEGAIRRTIEHGGAVMASERLPLGARLDFAAYAGQLAIPPLILGALARAILTGRSRVAVVLVGSYAAVTAGLGFDALRWETGADGAPLSTGERAMRAGRLALFGAVWLAAVPAALWRLATRLGPVTYDKMAHAGNAEDRAPGTPGTSNGSGGQGTDGAHRDRAAVPVGPGSATPS